MGKYRYEDWAILHAALERSRREGPAYRAYLDEFGLPTTPAMSCIPLETPTSSGDGRISHATPIAIPQGERDD